MPPAEPPRPAGGADPRRRAGTAAPCGSAETADPPPPAGTIGLLPGERDRRLARRGWVRRFVAGPDRLEEATRLYRELGHEVRLERPGEEELAAACRGCGLALELFRVLYTRPSRSSRRDPGNGTQGRGRKR